MISHDFLQKSFCSVLKRTIFLRASECMENSLMFALQFQQIRMFALQFQPIRGAPFFLNVSFLVCEELLLIAEERLLTALPKK